jgi:dienelactone hydrolase
VDFLHQFAGRLYRKRTKRRLMRHFVDRRHGTAIRTPTFGEAAFTEKCSGADGFSEVRGEALDLIRVRIVAKPLPSFRCFQQMMQSFKVLLVLAVLGTAGPPSVRAQTALGAQGAEGEPGRRQHWLVPSPDPDAASQAWLFRPAGDGPFPLAVIAHATTQNALRRAQMPQPDYRALSAWLVARGFAVLVPERPGHGATGGRYLEDQGGCDQADYIGAGRATARAIAAALDYMRGQAFIRRDGAVIAGHSAGAWGALALAGDNPQGVSAVIAFAPGRGGHVNDVPDQICAPQALISAAAEFGRRARVPVTWLVAVNDSYFRPAFSRQLADAFRAGGDKVGFHVLAASGAEGHWLAETEAGMKVAAPELDRALKALRPAAVKKR